MAVAGFVLLALSVPWSPSAIAATLRIVWASGTEADLAGYRLRLGTSPGQYTRTIEAGATPSLDVTDLALDQTYYFGVFAYDVAGNESAASAELSARIPSSLASAPVLDTIVDVESNSIYVVRGRAHPLLIRGRNIQSGATLFLGPGITAGPAQRTAPDEFSSTALVSASAAPGRRAATIVNPDSGTGSASGILGVVKTPDTNADCSVDIVDLNALARSWNQRAGEIGFAPSTDFDGDDYVGPEDLTIFVKFLGRPLAGCP